MKSQYTVKEQPHITAGGAHFQHTKALEKTFTATSRYGDTIYNYLIRGSGNHKWIVVPREACPVGVHDNRTEGLDVKFRSTFEPRNPEQAQFVQDLYSFLHRGESGIGEAPTGFGKTICALQVVHLIGKKTGVVVTKEDVKDQWIDAAKLVLGLRDKDIGIVQGNTCNVIGKKLVIFMIQSISRENKYEPDAFDDIGLMIWDEVHRVGADQFKQSIWRFKALLRLGLSATPTRKDGKEIVFHQHIGMVKAVTQQMKLIPKVFVQQSTWKMPAWMNKAKAGRTMHINKAMGRDLQRNMMIARFIFKAWQSGRNIIIFSDLIEHLEAMKKAAHSYGVVSSDMTFYIGGMSKKEREAAKIKRVLFSTYAFVSEATDIPWLDTAVLATPRSDVIQIVGRILREFEDKKQPVVYDILDPGARLLSAYYQKRLKWYKKIGCEVKLVSNKAPA